MKNLYHNLYIYICYYNSNKFYNYKYLGIQSIKHQKSILTLFLFLGTALGNLVPNLYSNLKITP